MRIINQDLEMDTSGSITVVALLGHIQNEAGLRLRSRIIWRGEAKS